MRDYKKEPLGIGEPIPRDELEEALIKYEGYRSIITEQVGWSKNTLRRWIGIHNLDYLVKSGLNSPEALKKRVLSYEQKYGVANPSKNTNIKEKKKQTFNNNYEGYSSITKKIKQTKLSKYGNSNYVNPEKAKQTKLERYGDENYTNVEKAEQTKLDKYGDKHYTNMDKRIETNMLHRGVPQVLLDPSVQEVRRITCLKLYGVDNTFSSSTFQNNLENTFQELYGVNRPFQSDLIRDKTLKTNLERYGVPYHCMTERCRKSHNTISKINKSFAELLTSKGLQYQFEFPLDNKSYDLKVGNTLIEINPTISHNSAWVVFGGGSKPPQVPTDFNTARHTEKTLIANKYGYDCIHVWDWDDLDKVVSTLIKPIVSINAEECTIGEVSEECCDSFLNKHHIQGTCSNQTTSIGLYYHQELIELITFSRDERYQYELLRVCPYKDYLAIGGLQRLFNYFLDKNNPTTVISYCDLSKFSSKVYEGLGFRKLNTLQPNKHWYNIQTKRHIVDSLLQQNGFNQLHEITGCSDINNNQLMWEHGYYPIYDCGEEIWLYESKL